MNQMAHIADPCHVPDSVADVRTFGCYRGG